jgi:hypothetical protein
MLSSFLPLYHCSQALVVDSDRSIFVLGLHHLPVEYAAELAREKPATSVAVRILDPVKKTVTTAAEGSGAGTAGAASFDCVLPASWEHLLINEKAHRVAKGRAGQLLGRMSVSATGQSS